MDMTSDVFDRLDAELARHPRVSLAPLPTSLDELPRLGERFGIRLSAKRDDTLSLAMGGNKVRQLEFYLGTAQRENADAVLITGAVQSNFVRLTAAATRKLGMEPVVQLEDRVPIDDVAYNTSGNVLLDHMFGATIHRFAEGEDEAAADANLDRIADELRADGRRPYVVHLGIDHPPTGGLGYVDAAAETIRQCVDSGRVPDHIVIPSGSGLTHAGFLVGARFVGWSGRLHGICVRRDASQQHQRILRRAREIAQMVNAPDLISEEDIIIDDSVLAPGYGRMNDAVAEAINLAAREEALLVDPVYSGRCMAGLIYLSRTGQIPPGSDVLFIHTGGGPALFAYERMIRDILDR